MKQIFSLLFLLVFFTFCNGQNNAKQKRSVVNKTKTITGYPKIIKTHGTGPYDNVCCGLQDKSGNLWFGTSGEGVYRYDGKSFTNFTDKDGLSSNVVRSIIEDKAGNIWFASAAGVCRYDGKNFTIIPISNSSNFLFNSLPNNDPSAKFTPSSMFQDKSGKIWLGTSSGVYWYNGTNFTRFLDNDNVINKNGLHLNMVQSIIEDKSGDIWFTTWFEGVCRYDGKSITNFKPNGEVWFAAILEDKNGNIWVGRRSKGVCRYDGKTFTNVLQKGIFDSCGVDAIIEDKAGNIWFGTEFGDMIGRESMGGVWRYDGKSFKNFTMKDGLTNYSVFSLVEDRAGNIWAGTRNTGLCRYNGTTFTSFSE